LDCWNTIGDFKLGYIEITIRVKMNNRVVILGGGESGTGAAILAKVKGYDVFVSDQSVIKESYRVQLEKYSIRYEEGVHTEVEILTASLIIKSPGIPDKAEIIKKIKSQKIQIIDEIEFASRFATGKIIAITGTNGKTTTTLLTYHLLKSAGYHVALGGNVGESFALKVALGNYDWYVLEVSSFQLDGTVSFRPTIGILTNITPDHLDRYDYKLENYIHSKFKLISNMNSSDNFIFYYDDPIVSKEIAGRIIYPKTTVVSLKNDSLDVFASNELMHFKLANEVLPQKKTTLKGPHNLINTMQAVSAALLAGVEISSIKASLKTFVNAPHRLESVAIIHGVEYVNDSKATNVDSVVYALGSFSQRLIWIAGGIDKGNEYGLVEDQVKEKVRVLICLGKDNQKLVKTFTGLVEEVVETQSINEVIEIAFQLAKPGEVVLLSPACASFDLFKNYEDRGDQFRQAVLNLRNRDLEKIS
jgi:UDP-N-acetylmuramoylalanine--D-glutamate ligase